MSMKAMKAMKVLEVLEVMKVLKVMKVMKAKGPPVACELQLAGRSRSSRWSPSGHTANSSGRRCSLVRGGESLQRPPSQCISLPMDLGQRLFCGRPCPEKTFQLLYPFAKMMFPWSNASSHGRMEMDSLLCGQQPIIVQKISWSCLQGVHGSTSQECNCLAVNMSHIGDVYCWRDGMASACQSCGSMGKS
mmetsp:Transcript_75585/g.166947  ORF Transcript_75585/g.166947 Transcript_75585/m.166947 type:complete len:190 (-) Transcript_75585:343-912(-)